MFSFGIALFVSLIVSLAILRFAHLGAGLDHNHHGVQKLHHRPVPRIGGLAVFLAAFISGSLILILRGPLTGHSIVLLLACSVPAFAGGLVEDLTRRVRPAWRMACMAVSCFLAFGLLDLVIPRVDIPGIDQLVAWPPFGLALTLLALMTITNGVNIIDGLNGLAAVVCTIILIALGYVAFKVEDAIVLSSSLMLAGAIAGFLVWNYPFGRIFLGDGGAYFLGFMLGALSILLVVRNPVVSAWFPLLLLAYPLVEVAFSIYRRMVMRGRHPGLPDAVHLHQLLYKRLVRWAHGGQGEHRKLRGNALTAPYLWVLSSLAVVPAALFFEHTAVLAPLFVLFVATYLWLYFRIVRLRAPQWLTPFRVRERPPVPKDAD
ncbi:MAG TPA: glycosyltransferase [Burkholderiaceae bacterium]|nr:glycosyltransferase [Burkholderiaceae bacterium]